MKTVFCVCVCFVVPIQPESFTFLYMFVINFLMNNILLYAKQGKPFIRQFACIFAISHFHKMSGKKKERNTEIGCLFMFLFISSTIVF